MKRSICAVLAVLLLLSACSRTAAATWREQYDLGVRYLSEGKYEEAILAFTAAIEIDRSQADAYLGLADAYVARGDTERARQVLENALAVVSDSDAVQSRLDILSMEEPEATPTPTTAPTPTPEPTPEPTPAFTVIASGDCGENLTWTLDSNGTLTVSGTGAMKDYGNYGPAPWDADRDSITRVVIENGVTFIGQGAFSGCSSLTSVTIPDGVIAINFAAFDGCSSLTSVTIPDSVIGIASGVFGACSSLTSVTIPDSVTSIPYAAFYDCISLKDVYYSGSAEQWEQIAIDNTGNLNDPLLGAAVHYNS